MGGGAGAGASGAAGGGGGGGDGRHGAAYLLHVAVVVVFQWVVGAVGPLAWRGRCRRLKAATATPSTPRAATWTISCCSAAMCSASSTGCHCARWARRPGGVRGRGVLATLAAADTRLDVWPLAAVCAMGPLLGAVLPSLWPRRHCVSPLRRRRPFWAPSPRRCASGAGAGRGGRIPRRRRSAHGRAGGGSGTGCSSGRGRHARRHQRHLAALAGGGGGVGDAP